jgi:putative sigma-54 modulation protein
MQIQITGRKVEITAAIRQFVEEKISKLSRHFDHITQVHVILSVDHERQIAEAKMHVSGGEVFAISEDKDLYAAIDLLHDKLDRQLIKHKEKMKEHKKVIPSESDE